MHNSLLTQRDGVLYARDNTSSRIIQNGIKVTSFIKQHPE